ncbi:type II toxin-antitoxin system YafQ family toxin [Stenoxybacter acetivorans]|uniref:type II toxin-antitoxin system YafQ family toxin n=1 Tax=Stenoxybacter acetivorans TaxID=422441 RepID=UPI0012ECA5F4
MYSLIHDIPLTEKYRDHQLTGNLKDYRECHVKPDLLLVYAKRGNELHLARLGTHSELFKSYCGSFATMNLPSSRADSMVYIINLLGFTPDTKF